LRVVKDPDAFPHNDWVVLKHLQTTPAEALKVAGPWRPWRAYGLMHLWRLAAIARGS
jgi:3-methyladenine DNA glycosylase/8-oxoguanine DNA glycosylase